MSYTFTETPTGVCLYCGKPSSALLTAEQAEIFEEHKYEKVALSEAFSADPPELQMLLILGTHPLCWDKHIDK